MKIKIIFLIFFLIFSFSGCDAFVRKFTRKPKKNISSQQEMVLVPEEYPSLFKDKEEQYHYYFSFWQSWHTEFINSLIEKTSHKKKISCLSAVINNLNILRDLLLDEKRADLEKYINELQILRDKLSKDIYTTQFNWYYNRAETLRKNILQNYSYSKIKNYLK
ncbi:MAG: hypothetical protein NC826_02900 [Candidatus Omnitrophica bacterium]|nr:hypothetical protein [Candidatus Omnitrophota bacterium]